MNHQTITSIQQAIALNNPLAWSGPMVIRQKQDTREVYHVDGQGFVTESLREATQYQATGKMERVPVNLLIGAGAHLSVVALIEIDSFEENYILARWGEHPLQLSLTDFQAQAAAAVYPHLLGLVRVGGTPYGPTVGLCSSDGVKQWGGFYRSEILLPEGMDDLLTPVSRLGSFGRWQVTGRLRLMGYRYAGSTSKGSFSIWHRQIGSHCLSLETGELYAPRLVSLETEHRRIVAAISDQSFFEVHPLLAALTHIAKSADSEEMIDSFKEAFPNHI